MKYVNSLKYMNSFEAAESLSQTSQKRMRELCIALGRVNVGTSTVFLPSGAAGHATAIMLESVIKSAGYRVGRITSVGGYDSRAIVYLDGEIAEIEEYNRAVAELKSVVLATDGEIYLREEASFALALLLCKMYGCEYIIFEGTSGDGYSFDAICAPYDLVVIPTVLDTEEISTKISCDAIRRGAREVISGNQKKVVYDMISSACVTGGVRLSFASKIGFEVEAVSSIKLGFSYCGRGGYTVKSPSLLQRDCAMLVIESALAIRRDGIKLPWASISTGLATANGAYCFEVLSASPMVIVDSAKTVSEVALLFDTFDEVFGQEKTGEICVCIPAEVIGVFDTLGDRKPDLRVIVGELSDHLVDDCAVCKNISEGAQEIVSLMKIGKDIVCFGSVSFALEIRTEIIKHMNA